MNEVGVCHISTQSPIAFDIFAENRATGSFILIDRVTNATVGAGMITHPLRRAANIHWQSLEVDKERARRHQGPEAGGALVHRPVGLGQVDDRQPAREEAARRRQAHLHARRRQCPPRPEPRPRLHRGGPRREHPARRRGGAADGRCRADRDRLVHLAVPRRARLARDRSWARASSSRCSSTRRSTNAPGAIPKGLYTKALSGEIKNFTGLDSPYEAPEKPEIHLEDARQISRGDGRRSRNMASRA